MSVHSFLASDCSHTFLMSSPSADELLLELAMIEWYGISVSIRELEYERLDGGQRN